MPRGRKPKSAAAKRLDGNPGTRPINDREPEPERGFPEPPANMPDDVVEAYMMIGRLVDGMGVLSVVDGILLSVAAYAYVRWDRTARWMVAGLTQEISGVLSGEDANQEKWTRSPMAIADRDNSKAIRECLTELGLTPTSRARLMTMGGDAKESREETMLKPFREDAG